MRPNEIIAKNIVSAAWGVAVQDRDIQTHLGLHDFDIHTPGGPEAMEVTTATSQDLRALYARLERDGTDLVAGLGDKSWQLSLNAEKVMTSSITNREVSGLISTLPRKLLCYRFAGFGCSAGQRRLAPSAYVGAGYYVEAWSPGIPEPGKYTSRMATATLSISPKRPQLWLLAIVALVLALIGGSLAVRLTREEPTALETYRALASSSFTEDLPLGIVLDQRGTRRLSGGELLGEVSFFRVRKTPGAEGGIVVVAYQIYRSPESAKTAYETYWRDLQEANSVPRRGYRFFETDVVRPHLCVDDVQVFCKIVVGNVAIEALSRIQLFKLREPSHVGAILNAALQHLDRTAESG